jgi:hypothetical protein
LEGRKRIVKRRKKKIHARVRRGNGELRDKTERAEEEHRPFGFPSGC